MPEINRHSNIVEALRSKTEEADMNQYLKSSLGGYTKHSVIEYLNVLRKQNQTTADTFSYNQQALFDEKKSLIRDNETLKNRLTQIEAEYRNLTEMLRANKLDGGELSASDVLTLKNAAAALEGQLSRNLIEKSKLEKQADQQNNLIKDLSQKLEQHEQEKAALREMIKTEMLESKKQRNTVSQLSATIEERDNEIKMLIAVGYKEQIAELNGEVTELAEQLCAQTELMAKANNENSLKQKTIETLNKENESLKQSISYISKSLETLREQNEKLLSLNNTLAEQLESEYKKSITLIKEKSGISIDKLASARKLEEANAKIVMLELQLQKQEHSIQLAAVSASQFASDTAIDTVPKKENTAECSGTNEQDNIALSMRQLWSAQK